MDLELMNDLTTKYMILGLVGAVVVMIVLNLRRLAETTKIVAIALVVSVAGTYAYNLSQEQNRETSDKTIAMVKNASDGFGSIVRQLKK